MLFIRASIEIKSPCWVPVSPIKQPSFVIKEKDPWWSTDTSGTVQWTILESHNPPVWMIERDPGCFPMMHSSAENKFGLFEVKLLTSPNYRPFPSMLFLNCSMSDLSKVWRREIPLCETRYNQGIISDGWVMLLGFARFPFHHPYRRDLFVTDFLGINADCEWHLIKLMFSWRSCDCVDVKIAWKTVGGNARQKFLARAQCIMCHGITS